MYELKIGTLRLAQRASIIVESEEINTNLRDGAAGGNAVCTSGAGDCTGQAKNFEIILTLKFIANGDFAAADRLYQQVKTYLDAVCKTNVVQFRRRTCDEPYEEYPIASAYMLRKNMADEFQGIKTGEVHLTTVEVGVVETAVISIVGIPPAS